MTCSEEICFEPKFRFLICKIHGSGVHPTREAIKRHLRGDGHCCKGLRLRQAVSELTSLPLRSLQEVINDQPALETQPITPPILHLKVLQGWNCVPCEGRTLTISLEIIQRHSALVHGRQRGDPPMWTQCQLQTFFSETKDRRYFRVGYKSAVIELDGGHGFELGSQNKPRPGQVLCGQTAQAQGANAAEHSNIPPASMVSSISTEDIVSTLADSKKLQESQISRLQKGKLSVAQSITVQHPSTHIAERHVHLPLSRLDYLFKSGAFRYAPNPVFDGSHVDAALSMTAVFPRCEDEPLFLNALVFSIIQAMNKGTLMMESILLEERIVQLINMKLTSRLETVSPGVIGAIMLLKSSAYRARNVAAHDVHTRGLSEILKLFKSNGGSLIPAVLRAAFWLDLNAAIVVDSKRQMSHLDLPQRVSWQREGHQQFWHLLPVGFARHKYTLPHELLACIVDIVELQATLFARNVPQRRRTSKFHELDAMQASIESRLAFQVQECRQHGVVAEAIRLAVFMCCYCSWTETWNDSLIPCRLAEMLLDLLEPTILLYPQQLTTTWLQHIDVLLWLLLVGCNVAMSEWGDQLGLKSRQSCLIKSVASLSDILCNYYGMNIRRRLQDGLTDFIYADLLENIVPLYGSNVIGRDLTGQLGPAEESTITHSSSNL
ncbi:hypothetical protein GGI43DRAFT_432577 [Trichoderma evansii]